MDTPLNLLVASVSVTADALGGERDHVGLIARPGAIIVVPVPPGSPPLTHLRTLEHQPADALVRSGDAILAISAGEVNGLKHRHPALGRTERIDLETARGPIRVARAGKQGDTDHLRRAGQRAFGFTVVPPRNDEDVVLGLQPVSGANRPWGLVALADGLRLFEVQPPNVAARGRAIVKSVAGFAAQAAAYQGPGSSVGGFDSPGGAYQRERVAAFRKGREAPRPPAEAGAGEGRVTAMLIHEGDPSAIRADATVDGRTIQFSCPKPAHAQLRHVSAASLGEAACATAS